MNEEMSFTIRKRSLLANIIYFITITKVKLFANIFARKQSQTLFRAFHVYKSPIIVILFKF